MNFLIILCYLQKYAKEARRNQSLEILELTHIKMNKEKYPDWIMQSPTEEDRKKSLYDPIWGYAIPLECTREVLMAEYDLQQVFETII